MLHGIGAVRSKLSLPRASCVSGIVISARHRQALARPIRGYAQNRRSKRPTALLPAIYPQFRQKPKPYRPQVLLRRRPGPRPLRGPRGPAVAAARQHRRKSCGHAVRRPAALRPMPPPMTGCAPPSRSARRDLAPGAGRRAYRRRTGRSSGFRRCLRAA